MYMKGFVLLLLIAASNAAPLLIGAFNIQVFGKSKMGKPDVVDVLVKIVKRYDILLVQEIRDIDEVAFPQLVRDVNAASSDPYEYVLSGRTGRTSSKEQYGFIYRPDKVRVTKGYQHPDNQDVFEREPYTVQFERLSGESGSQRKFSYVPLHAKPDDAVEEIDALAPLYDDVTNIFGDEDVLLAGDFNADCSYVCSSCWDGIALRTDTRFDWRIDDDADTTVSTTNCAYDRIVLAGSSLKTNSGTAKVFRYDIEYRLSYEEAKDVSDHYPVEFYLN